MGLFLDAFALNQIPKAQVIHVTLTTIFHLLSALADLPVDDRFPAYIPIWAWLVPKIATWMPLLSGARDERARTNFFSFVIRLYANLIAFVGCSEVDQESEHVTNIRG